MDRVNYDLSMDDLNDRDLLPVPERDFLTREEAEEDDTVDMGEHDEDW